MKSSKNTFLSVCFSSLPPSPPLYLHFCMRVRFKDFGSLSLETEQMENAWKVVPLVGIFVFVCHFYVCIFLAPTGAPVAIVVYYTSWSGGNFFRFQIGVGGLITHHLPLWRWRWVSARNENGGTLHSSPPMCSSQQYQA